MFCNTVYDFVHSDVDDGNSDDSCCNDLHLYV